MFVKVFAVCAAVRSIALSTIVTVDEISNGTMGNSSPNPRPAKPMSSMIARLSRIALCLLESRNRPIFDSSMATGSARYVAPISALANRPEMSAATSGYELKMLKVAEASQSIPISG